MSAEPHPDAVVGAPPAVPPAPTVSPVALATPANPVVRGILFAVLAVSLFALQNAAAKWLAADLAPLEIVFFRNLAALIPVSIVLWRAGGVALLHTARPFTQVGRGLIMAAGTCAVFAGLGRLPLADVTALTFAVPLFVTVLSVPFLGERVGWRRWSAVLVGFAGVMVVTQPGAGTLDPIAPVVLAGAGAIAFVMVLGRRLSRTEHTATIAFYSLIGAIAGTGLALPVAWTTPTLPQVGILAGMGLVSGVAMLLMTGAYRLAPAAVAAPFEYLHIVWAIALGLLLWGDVPGVHVALGAAIVISSGLYILHRETRRGNAPATKAGALPRT